MHFNKTNEVATTSIHSLYMLILTNSF